MSTLISTYLFTGGLDLLTPYFSLPPGRLIECVNYECLPEGGYRRIDGYELFDGSDNPSPVPGEGDIRGVWVFKGDTYAFRDQASNGGMFKATATGWQTVDFGYSLAFDQATRDFQEGDTVTGATSGATATVERVLFKGGTISDGSAKGALTLSNIAGVFVDDEALRVGSQDTAVSDGVVTANQLPKGGRYDFRNHNFFGQDGSERMYAANGVGPAFEFDGANFVFIDLGLTEAPAYIHAHKSHLIIAYASGSLINSSLGNPTEYNPLTGSGEIAVGDTIVDLQSLPGGVLQIGCKDSIQMLYGNDSDSFQLQQYADHGLQPFTVGEIGGSVMVLDDRGVQNLRASQVYGDFESSTLSRPINKILSIAKKSGLTPVATVSRDKSQYRLFYGSDGYWFTFAGQKLAGIGSVSFDHPVLVACNGESDAGEEITFFGSEDGKVFQSDIGYTFDNERIRAFLKFPFNHVKGPTRRKQYRRILLDMRSEGDGALIQARAEYGFDNVTTPDSTTQNINAAISGGGTWDFDVWDGFNWDSPLNSEGSIKLTGIATNMSLTLFSAGEENGSHTFYGASLHYSPRRLER